MRGHIRRRGKTSYEYIVDIGPASAQRCQDCNKRFWLERKPKKLCPRCGGQLAETEERRRAIKGGYATQRECQAALNKVLTAVEARTFVAPTRITVKDFLLCEWLPAVKGTLRPTTYASYTMLATQHIIPRLGTLQLQNLSAAAINALYAYLAEEGRVRSEGGLSPSSVRRVHAVLHRACRDAVRWGRLTVNPVDAADPPKTSAEHTDRLPVWSSRAALRLPCKRRRRSPLRPLATVGHDRHAQRRGPRSAVVVPRHGEQHADHSPGLGAGQRRSADERAQDPPRSQNDRPRSCDAGGSRAHAARQADERSHWDVAWIDAGFVFTGTDGQPLHPWVVSKAFRDHRTAAMLPEIPLHGLRHTYATLALWRVASTRASSRHASAMPPWPSPWTSTPTSCRKQIRRRPTGSPSCWSASEPRRSEIGDQLRIGRCRSDGRGRFIGQGKRVRWMP